MRIAIGADRSGYEYKEILKGILQDDPRISEVHDFGVSSEEDTDFPHIGIAVGRDIAEGKADRGLVLCGTGAGVAISANKVPGIRAAIAHDSFSIEHLIVSNNAQVLALGQKVIGVELAKKLVAEWLDWTFDPTSATAHKVDTLNSYEASNYEGETLPACG